MAATSRVEQYAAIRRDARLEGLSIRALADKHGVHRRTVRQALASPWPEPRKKPPVRRSRLDPFKPVIDQMLREDLDAPRKQRHTVKRIFDRLVAEHEMEGSSYATVVDYVAVRRPQVRVEAGRGPEQVFITQTTGPAPRPRSTSAKYGSTWPASSPSATCSHCGCSALPDGSSLPPGPGLGTPHLHGPRRGRARRRTFHSSGAARRRT